MFYRITELDIALQKYTFVISKSNNRLVRCYEASPMKPSFLCLTVVLNNLFFNTTAVKYLMAQWRGKMALL